ncbi:hypothetical protein SAMN05216389_104158 [Oceanobacillus limi]|uniref:Uncharacterized protein n=1 Tax=Oceanobacillus limi TaxID=930131 RepID=A0A1I0B3L9_9BACI|nr:hypothetical protein SAMN05216389_104158 [Oceanobacillus limi]
MSGLPTKELAVEIEKSEIELFKSRLSSIEAQPGNPMGVELKDFGGATAFSAKQIPGPSYNTVKGISGDSLGYVDPIIKFYEKRGIPTQFEITPVGASSELFKLIYQKGFYQHAFHTSFIVQLIK